MLRPNLLRLRYTLLNVPDIGTSSHFRMWSLAIGSSLNARLRARLNGCNKNYNNYNNINKNSHTKDAATDCIKKNYAFFRHIYNSDLIKTILASYFLLF